MTGGLRFPKPRARALEKQDRAKRKQSVEARENANVRARSRGQCEVYVMKQLWNDVTHTYPSRCASRASEIHHLLGGSGRRGVRESALAQNKLHVCGPCHDLITRHILQGQWTDVENRAGTVTYVRVK